VPIIFIESEKRKNPLSRAFGDLYKTKKERVLLEDDIFKAWKQYTDVRKQILSDLKAAFKFRQWLAHGRYWPLGRQTKKAVAASQPPRARSRHEAIASSSRRSPGVDGNSSNTAASSTNLMQ
jgi:hypothetical protein